MAGVRAQLARTRRLEAAQLHPILAALGGEEGWVSIQADAKIGTGDGRYDSRDIPVVIEAIRTWLTS